ncbi:MAG: nitroreductase family protein [Desulfobacterales bacterium]|uniref:Nitroreductase family protein n=1 Tax=Candidatus Desulfaltia bathyphila TaxID=2841697 RepID=A0A8J6N3Q7_9BACT|nr:nitroreductase family protein [Candidatus Desulfaltia bathyphila]MBL7194827.1 nitroreductase family protein [Desulfobacterales bacterium]MBL7206941.1 nitroreductase family protein [Desulfobacterales bacterium]
MTDLMEVIKGRRSIRKYEEKDIPEELVYRVLDAVRWTPSWVNTQCWEVIVVKDKIIKERLQAAISKGNPAAKSIVAAPVVLAVCSRLGKSGYYKDKVSTKFGDWYMFDLGLATQNLCLMAHHLGLGTVIVGLFDHDRAGKILKVPAGYELVVLIPMGYPAKTPSAPKRREINEFTHYNIF